MAKRKKKVPKEPTKIEVIWKDANHDCDNQEMERERKPSRLKTIAYLIKKNKDGDLELAAEIDLDDPRWVRHTSVIPYGMIEEYWEI